MNWEITIKGEDEETYVDRKILNEKDLILCTNGFCILDLDQFMNEACFEHEKDGIIDKEKVDEWLDEFITQVYDYAYDCAEEYANNNEMKIKGCD